MSEYVVDIVIGEERHLFGVVDEFIFEKEYDSSYTDCFVKYTNDEHSIGIYVKSIGSALSVSLYKNGELLPPKDVYSVNRYLKKCGFKLRLSVKDFK